MSRAACWLHDEMPPSPSMYQNAGDGTPYPWRPQQPRV